MCEEDGVGLKHQAQNPVDAFACLICNVCCGWRSDFSSNVQKLTQCFCVQNPLAKEETKGMSGASTGTPATPERVSTPSSGSICKGPSTQLYRAVIGPRRSSDVAQSARCA